MSDFYFTSFVDSHPELSRWDPVFLSYLGLLPSRLGRIRSYLHGLCSDIDYYRGVFIS